MTRRFQGTTTPWRAAKNDEWITNGSIWICTRGGTNARFVNQGAAIASAAQGVWFADSAASVFATQLLFANSNGVSFGVGSPPGYDGVVTASHNGITTGMLSDAGSNFVAATAGFAGTSASGTIGSAGLSISIGPYLTTAMASNAGPFLTTAALSNHSHGNPTLNLTNISGTTASASNGLTLSLSAGAGGGVIGTSVESVASALSVGTVTRYAPEDHKHAGLYAINVGGNTSGGNTSSGAGSFMLAGGPNITLSGATGAGGMTLSVSAAAAAGATMSEWCPYPEMNVLTASALVNNSIYFNPVDVQENLNAYRANFFLSVATVWNAAGNNTRSAGYTLSFCLYSRGAGVSTERLMSLLSRSAFISIAGSSVSNVSATHPFGISNSTAVSTSQYASAATNASVYLVNSVGGFRVLPFPISSTLTPGRYWMAVAQSSVSSHASAVLNCSVLQQTHGSNIAYKNFGSSSGASDASFYQIFPGRGVYSATSGAFPATIALTNADIRQLATTVVLPFFNVSGYTTSTNWL